MQEVSITPEGIQKNLKNYKPLDALGEEQLSQLKKYLRVIKKDDRFNRGNAKCTFYLVGNKFNASGFLEGELKSKRSLEKSI